MTDQTNRLAEIRARVEVATPGPWEWDAIDEGSLHTIDPLGDPVARKYGLRAQILGTGEYNRKTPNRADATFIANAREDVPYLLDLVVSLTAERDAELARKDEWHKRFDVIAAELARLRAVIEEAQARLGDFPARLDHEGLDGMGNEANDVVALLDRGMKGENND